jgi:hypothetical protein
VGTFSTLSRPSVPLFPFGVRHSLFAHPVLFFSVEPWPPSGGSGAVGGEERWVQPGFGGPVGVGEDSGRRQGGMC